MTNVDTLNAEHIKKSSTLFRTLFLALIWAALSFGLSCLLYGVGLGYISVVWNLAVGPILLPFSAWMYLKFFRKLNPVDLRRAEHGEIAQCYFECLLKKAGPRPIFYTYEASDLSIFWLERRTFKRSEQIVLIPTAWFNEPALMKRQDFESIWEHIHDLSRFQRRVRTLQYSLWLALLFPLELLTFVFQKIEDAIGFKDLPFLGFWMFQFLKSFQSFWFGLSDQGDSLGGDLDRQALRVPRSWRSLSFGVWALMPQRYLHPLSKVMTQRDIVLS